MLSLIILGSILTGIGIIGLTLVLVFKKKINKFYENIEGLSEAQANYYKNGIIIFLPIFFIIMGLVILFTQLSSEPDTLDKIFSIFDSPILGIILIVLGLFSMIMRFTKYKYKVFAKLAPMEIKYGKEKANKIHIFSYTIIPILAGIALVLKFLKII